MRDVIDDIAPGSFDVSNVAELLAVIIGAYLIVDGRVDLGVLLIGLGVGYENIDKLREKDHNA